MTSNKESNQDVDATPSAPPEAADSKPASEPAQAQADSTTDAAAAAPSKAPEAAKAAAPDDSDDDVIMVEEEPDGPEEDPVVAERDKLKDQLLRTAADFENYRRRARREAGEAKLRGRDDALMELLPVFDNLERAVSAADGAQEVASVVEGVRMVLKLFQDTAERMGLQRVEAVGARFDPAVHEAIQQQETDEFEPGTVTTEVIPGYMFGQRLLRAAMVIVARKPKDKPKQEQAPAEVTQEPKGDAPAEAKQDRAPPEPPASSDAPKSDAPKSDAPKSDAPAEANKDSAPPAEEDAPQDTE